MISSPFLNLFFQLITQNYLDALVINQYQIFSFLIFSHPPRHLQVFGTTVEALYYLVIINFYFYLFYVSFEVYFINLQDHFQVAIFQAFFVLSILITIKTLKIYYPHCTEITRQGLALHLIQLSSIFVFYNFY